ncbi:UDP-4-amino-4,6-dideoxy-N-acetyl-beta-L-altrosamine transaminase [Chromobacterium piscinae]|uniref:UDP-4-amino-4, 6-dideoxy-N-acetyl-beta-L-altrosamine transaminase n=1 Tax=Chromobacterium piscinae TaxID=686831 RepID=UPI00140BAE77|nr:UDP-4-amino-4,6-dideoxy-N-acetyl-beta-L-altrosamine transaminase [Chromobacterium piscinae]MBX9295079.1 UDP-4-amino-4,6-dideoxy-N-acetyl-beta-L-altrosamine transaminase [Chromobacterium vaccinii]MBX9358845.1 UDP-4-amino-4,6-dideoxy-N-acetyl-beta-L-altrosamine transaminase [Chromobacterium vaccinii]MCD4506173.1 UDP-4-amino-4,6-dideoxy-N-acetyl-beta-L-altrosamine transaminase [Chromobacterium piscinae]NHQ82513.1 UDP-4-amino-4,6-dideoxy-N-acetyl-beta-L-altrosamine transaminase [Chromobacterium 
MKFIPYGRQDIDQIDEQTVLDTLRSDFLTQGPKVAEFEQALCNYTGARYCVAVASGTAALHLAVAALELPEGSEGITSTNTFTASANSMVYCGVKPVFADIDSRSYNIDPRSILEHITAQTRLVTAVHFAGQTANMAAIASLAQEHGLRVIEDAAHAIGSNYPDGSKVGNCKYSDLTIFSFHPVKTMTTGEGGAVMTNDADLYQRMLLLRSHGISKDPSRMSRNPGPWYYEMQALGWHYRLTDMQAALGLSQLSKIESFKARRREIVANYNAVFGQNPLITTPHEEMAASSCFHLYVLKLNFEQLGKSRVDVMQQLVECGIGSQVHYIPVHTQPWYQDNFSTRQGDCPIAEEYYQSCLSLPLYSSMSDDDQRRVISAVNEIVKCPS